eukprot:PLAT2515.1.p1 GENE.PLAT2515.1~~PLAT2515.1.p1  ORF type:complete len:856 (+),score=262.15 PLAT2515.1:212-2569(+)
MAAAVKCGGFAAIGFNSQYSMCNADAVMALSDRVVAVSLQCSNILATHQMKPSSYLNAASMMRADGWTLLMFARDLEMDASVGKSLNLGNNTHVLWASSSFAQLTSYHNLGYGEIIVRWADGRRPAPVPGFNALSAYGRFSLYYLIFSWVLALVGLVLLGCQLVEGAVLSPTSTLLLYVLFLSMAGLSFFISTSLPPAAVGSAAGAHADVAVYYGTLVLLSFLLLSNLARPSSRLFALKRLHVLHVWRWRVTWSVGVLLLAVLYILLHVFVLSYSNAVLPMTAKDRLARTLGHVTELNMALLTLPVARNSFLFLLYGISFDRALFIHRFLGRVVFFSMLLHLLTWLPDLGKNAFSCAFLFSCPGSTWQRSLQYGTAAFYCTVVLVFFALDAVRRRAFELFYSVHHLFLPILLLAILHTRSVAHGRRGHLLHYIVLSGFSYATDRLYRILRSKQSKMATSKTSLNGKVTVLRVQQPAETTRTHQAGQFYFINIPQVNLWQWHPFSIVSPPGAKTLAFMCKSYGSWTKSLLSLTDEEQLSVFLDGPYGTNSIPMQEYSHFVLGAAGIGITPCLSIMLHLMNLVEEQARERQLVEDISTAAVSASDLSAADRLALLSRSERRTIKSVLLIWVVRDQWELQMCDWVITRALKHVSGAFDVRLFVTGRSREMSSLVLSDAEAAVEESPIKPHKLDGLGTQPVDAAAMPAPSGGRPDLRELLDEQSVIITKSSGDEKTVIPTAFFYCGPEGFCNDATDAASKVNARLPSGGGLLGARARARFDCYSESFAL